MALQARELDTPSTTGPVLADGTSVASLIDLERRHVSLRLFSDPEVYEVEQRWLFGRTWNIVAHETEIPDAGDYVLRHIAGDPIIVTRGREGEISVMLNVCTHRGMQVCRSESGNASNFKCPYHGWVFGTEGNLLGAPFEREMYGSDLDKPNLGLRRAQVDQYGGFVFANWDDAAPPLDDFLGEYRYYMDMIFHRLPAGLECVGAPQRFRVQSNWKAPSEQFNGADGYHAATLHRSLVESMVPGGDAKMVQDIARQIMFGIDIGSPMGHGVRTGTGAGMGDANGRTDIEMLQQRPPAGMTAEMVPLLTQNLTPGQIHQLVASAPGPGGMFPNVGFLHMNLRVHVPVGHDAFEMMNWILVEKDAPAAVKTQVRQQGLLTFGTSGTVEQDDAESWPSIQNSSKGYMGRQQSMKYQAFIGHNPPEGWEGGAHVYPGFTKDDSAWDFWQRYREYLDGGSLFQR